MLRTIRVQEADFSIGEEIAQLHAALGARMGALSMFCGLVRERPDVGQSAVDALYLEHYPGMTEASIERILDRAAERWPLQGVVVIHRVGTLLPGEQIVLVLAAAAHRAAALEATAFVIDFLKTDAVFWKKETSGQRGHWVESRSDDFERARGWRDADR